MEKHGIIRRIDDLGRIVIPREIRRQDEFTTILCYDHDGSDESLI